MFCPGGITTIKQCHVIISFGEYMFVKRNGSKKKLKKINLKLFAHLVSQNRKENKRQQWVWSAC